MSHGCNGKATNRQGASSAPEAFAPFLREATLAFPDLVEAFAAKARRGRRRALTPPATTSATELRRRRHGLALAVALGDLAGEFDLEQVTAMLSDFADDAIDRALAAAIAERVPDAEPAGIAVIALGKLGSRELNYSSDVDLILLFDPGPLPRRERDDAGEAAVRDRPPADRAAPATHRRRLCRAGRLAAAPVAGSDADRAAGRRGDFLL